MYFLLYDKQSEDLQFYLINLSKTQYNTDLKNNHKLYSFEEKCVKSGEDVKWSNSSVYYMIVATSYNNLIFEQELTSEMIKTIKDNQDPSIASVEIEINKDNNVKTYTIKSFSYMNKTIVLNDMVYSYDHIDTKPKLNKSDEVIFKDYGEEQYQIGIINLVFKKPGDIITYYEIQTDKDIAYLTDSNEIYKVTSKKKVEQSKSSTIKDKQIGGKLKSNYTNEEFICKVSMRINFNKYYMYLDESVIVDCILKHTKECKEFTKEIINDTINKIEDELDKLISNIKPQTITQWLDTLKLGKTTYKEVKAKLGEPDECDEWLLGDKTQITAEYGFRILSEVFNESQYSLKYNHLKLTFDNNILDSINKSFC